MFAVLVTGFLAAPGVVPAVAAPGDLAFGVVSADANKNGVLEPAGVPADVGVPGIALTLRCESPLDAAQPGWSTTTDANGAWSFAAADINLADQCEVNSDLILELNSSGAAGDVLAVFGATSAYSAFAAVAGENQIAVSEPFAVADAPVELNALVWPTWNFSLGLVTDPSGFGGNSVYTGSGPFDADGTEPGSDTGPANDGRIS